MELKEIKEIYEDVIIDLYEELFELEREEQHAKPVGERGATIPGINLESFTDNEPTAVERMKINIRNHHFIYQRDLKKDKFGLIEDEFIYCANRLNGVLPTIYMEQELETIRTNILIGQPREETRLLPEKLEKLSFWQTLELYAQIRQYWADSQ